MRVATSGIKRFLLNLLFSSLKQTFIGLVRGTHWLSYPLNVPLLQRFDNHLLFDKLTSECDMGMKRYGLCVIVALGVGCKLVGRLRIFSA